MKFYVTIEWSAPGSIPQAVEAIRKQMEALNVGYDAGYKVISVQTEHERLALR